jgi:maltose alpha-D-glucosyltransferase/alpha-amylase
VRPLITEGPFDYRRLNVADQQTDAGSLLNTVKRLTHTRRRCSEIGLSPLQQIETDIHSVFAHRYDGGGHTFIAVHNFDATPARIPLTLQGLGGRTLHKLLGTGTDASLHEGRQEIELGAFGYQWYRT